MISYSTVQTNIWAFSAIVVFGFFKRYNKIGGTMTYLKKIILIIVSISSFVINIQLPANSRDEITIIMCGPTSKQIENINQLYERNLLALDHIKLICVYHQDERIYHKPSFEQEIITDYQTAIDYANENNLDWVSFESIKGSVELKNLFKNNIWTPQFKKLFEKSQGIIFTGGYDIPPSIYGEENCLLTDADTPIRSVYECSFLFHLLGGSQNPNFTAWLESKKNYVILGICLGAQTLNVATGGSLYQDIPWQIYGLHSIEQVLKLSPDKIHSSFYVSKLYPLEKDLAPAFHQIKFIPDSIWIRKMGLREFDHPYVLSSHHQAIKKTGKNIQIIATSLDVKIIEAITHSRFKNVLGIQFHPEYYPIYQKSARFKILPGKLPTFNIRSFLVEHPPSMAFHRKLWKWFSEALLEM
jgi:putative glutamine amidotransferase